MSFAIGALPAPAQWTVDQLLAAMRSLVTRAEAQRVRISETNAGVMALDAKANAIADPVKRAEVKAAVRKAYDAQVSAVRHWREFTARFADLSRQAQAWMNAHGIRATAPALSGLGVVQLLVPVVVVGVYLTALTIIGYLEKQTAINKQQVEGKLRLVDDYLAGRITTEQFRVADASLDRTLDSSRPSDPFGFEQLGKALLPIAIILAAAFVIPRVVDALGPRRQERLAA